MRLSLKHAPRPATREPWPAAGAVRGTWLPVVSEYCTQGQLSVMVMKCEGALPSVLFQQRTYASCSAISGLPGNLCGTTCARYACIKKAMDADSSA